jgi:hypothetical protein
MRYSMATADEALDACFQAGAISLCTKHSYNIIRSTDPALKQKAYEIVAIMIDRGQYSSDLSILMHAIDDTIEMAQDECRCCANARAYHIPFPGKQSCPCSAPTCPAFRDSQGPDYSI